MYLIKLKCTLDSKKNKNIKLCMTYFSAADFYPSYTPLGRTNEYLLLGFYVLEIGSSVHGTSTFGILSVLFHCMLSCQRFFKAKIKNKVRELGRKFCVVEFVFCFTL